MKTLARFTMDVGIAVGTTGCLGPKEMPASNLTPEHAKWIADVTPILGTWLGGIENEDAWVDGFRTDESLIVMAARAQVPDFRVDVRPMRGWSMLRHPDDADAETAMTALTKRIDRLEHVAPNTSWVAIGTGVLKDGAISVAGDVRGEQGAADCTRSFVGLLVLDPDRRPFRATSRADMTRPE